MKGQKKLTRREMLKLSGTVAAGSLLAACAPAVAPTPVPPTPVPPTVAPTAVPPTVAPTKVPPTSAPAPAVAAGPVTLEVHDPTGAYEITRLHPPRLDTLAGKTICQFTNGAWQSERMFPVIAELLRQQYPTAKIIADFPRFGEGNTDEQMAVTAALATAAGCDAAIIGNAG